MTKLHKFIIHSDFKMLANDGEGTMSLTIPNSFSISAGGHKEFFVDKVIGQRNAPIMAKMSSSKTSSFVAPATSLIIKVTETITIGGQTITSPVNNAVYIYRLNPTTLRMKIYFDNRQAPSTKTISNAGQTITARIRTFRDPFIY